MGPLAEPCVGPARQLRRCCPQLVHVNRSAILRRATPAICPSRRRWALAASSDFQPSPDSSSKTIRSLDNLLGSNDSLDSLDTLDIEEGRRLVNGESWERKTRTRVRRVPDANVRRVRPLYVYVIYYCFICVYLSSAWLEATDGYLAASVLQDGLVNDHLAVATGQVPRLATAGFVCDSPLELFMQLATLLTVGAEAEALLGHSLFWAVYWLGNLSGSLADAVGSELPVTYGPANAAAGMVGALVAFYVRNWALEERIESEREHAREARRAAVAAKLGPAATTSSTGSRDGAESDAGSLSSRDGDAPGSSSSSSSTGGSSSRRGGQLEEGEAEVEILPFWSIRLSARMSATARGALNVLGSLVVASQGLLEFGDASRSASWIGLIAAFWTGSLLTFLVGPHYEVQLQPPPTPAGASAAAAAAAAAATRAAGAGDSSLSSGSSSSRSTGDGVSEAASSGAAGGRAAAAAAAAVSRAVSWTAKEGPVKADADGLRVVDVCPPARRPAVLLGAVGALAAGIGGWLAYMGVDM
ncbi:hypothetical protein HXX76_009021 [Chlamydomonas incerta]|uniref:Peptidase S54 rhomboid domain-containing protein n=1 Tax=Chlamydomonas incerta TaxID=51695 RepID=A0A835T1I2_CHLIN|nr:hypothetical protein HXX76_009021 [Chlamydomonas incerta]|eukprot:KAG2432094.1 hypothetical protein HXX76_009021 [Chlamydomonas incerta]